METWKDVVGYEDLYKVSDLGRVRSSDRMSHSRGGSLRKQLGRIIAGGIN